MPACPGCGVDNPERARFCLECGLPLIVGRAAVGGSRRTVTVLFSDIVGSTALGELLDPEAVHLVVSSYFDEMRAVIERHGGTVEKFIGDAIMAVFGLPVLHEDDALRAVRAAVGMGQALAALNGRLEAERGVTIAIRTGLNTGEVLAGDPSARQTLVTGDAVNTAARLEQAAGAGEILLGVATWRLVRDVVTVEPVPAIGARARPSRCPPSGCSRCVREPSARLAATPHWSVAAASWTSSGLVRARRGRPATGAGHRPRAGRGRQEPTRRRVRRGARATERPCSRGAVSRTAMGSPTGRSARCSTRRPGSATTTPRRKAFGSSRRFCATHRDRPLLADRLASAIGLSAAPFPQDELFWAIRRTVADLAADRPLVLIVEDLQWAEPTLRDLIEHLVDQSADSPLLLVCPARPEIHDGTTGWPADRSNVETIALEGLSPDAMAQLVDSLPGGAEVPMGLRQRILATAEGNPLFVEEMVALLVEEGIVGAGDAAPGGSSTLEEIRVPPTIQALLAARFDRLPVSERSTAQRASVVGRVFEEAAVEALSPEGVRAAVPGDLNALVLKQLLAPETSGLTEDEAFKFRHILARDAAYLALAKADRAILHERFADWLEAVAGPRVMEYQEILGYHLAEAHRYRSELREPAERTDAIGRRAGAHLHAAGRRARDRGDAAASTRLLARAESLPSRDPVARAALLLDHGLALSDLGRSPEARTRAADALTLATGVGNGSLAAQARLLRLEASKATGDLVTADPAVGAELAVAVHEAEASGDPRALAQAWHSLSNQAWNEGRVEESEDQMRVAIRFARAADDPRLELDIEVNLMVATFAGPLPASDFVALAEGFIGRAAGYPTVRAECQVLLAVSEAMLGRFEAARTHATESIAVLTDLANAPSLVNARTFLAWTERLAGDLPAAEAVLRTALAEADAMGEAGLRSFVSCRLAEVLVAQGRLDDAALPLAEAERDPIGATASRIAGMIARMKATRGDPTAADDVDALMAMVSGRWPNVRTEALLDAAEAMLALDDRAAADRYAGEALRLCRAKENLALARRVEVLIARIADEGRHPDDLAAHGAGAERS